MLPVDFAASACPLHSHPLSQALMELVLAVKKALQRGSGPLPTPSPSPRDIVYVQGREGPLLCSVVNLTNRVILDSPKIVWSE